MMSRERFLDAADAVRREEKDAQKIADFIDTFSTSVSIFAMYTIKSVFSKAPIKPIFFNLNSSYFIY